MDTAKLKSKFFERLRTSTCAGALVLAVAVSPALGDQVKYDIDIPASTLDKALNAFGTQAGVNIIYEGRLPTGLSAPRLNGAYDLETALQHLLGGSAYTYKILSDKSIAIIRSKAQRSEHTLDAMMVTASRAEKPVSAVPGSVAIITSEEIQREQALGGDPAALIGKYIPGYALNNESLSGASESFRGRSVLVMVDGVTRSTPLRNASRVISTIGLQNIKRIEVVSGASSMYGAGASGGIINLITKEAAEKGMEVTVSGFLTAFTADIGDSLSPELSVDISGTQEKFDYLFNIKGKMSQDTFDGDGNLQPSDPFLGQGGLDNTKNLDMTAKVGTNFKGQRLELTHNTVLMDQKPDYYADYSTPRVSPDLDNPYVGDSVREQSHYTTLTYTNDDVGIGSLDLQVYYNDIDKRFAFVPQSSANTFVYYANGQISPDGQTTLKTKQIGTRATVVTPLDQLVEGADLTWGSDFSFDETTQVFNDGVNAIAPMEQYAFSAFAQASTPVGDVGNVTGGVRYERFSLDIKDFLRPRYNIQGLGTSTARFVHGDEKTYNALVWNIGAVGYVTDESEVFAGFSQGYTIPDIGAFTRRAGAATTAQLLSTADVYLDDVVPDAQVVNTYELGYRGDWGKYRLNTSAYVSTSKKGVTIDSSSLTLSQQKERIWGAEFTGETSVTDDISVGTVFSYTEGVYDSDKDGKLDYHLPNNRIPSPYRLTLYGDFALPYEADLRLESVASSGRSVYDGSNTVKLDPSVVFNMAVSMPLLGGTAQVGVKNILDNQYDNQTASAVRNRNVAGMGRTVGLGYTVKF
ncbi:TonB-dependent receptor domain-containing protein [Terasakiella pusilla]|uniref:TonB-dependent receptor domain-containing protein n=1 Tax=Terasakiella pusilla TaxID=64973 RepID=UPI003AA804EB